MKKYQFSADELEILREALAEYKHFIKPEPGASQRRITNAAIATALYEQFRDDLRLDRE